MKKLENLILNDFDYPNFDLGPIFNQEYVVYKHTSEREECHEFAQEEV